MSGAEEGLNGERYIYCSHLLLSMFHLKWLRYFQTSVPLSLTTFKCSIGILAYGGHIRQQAHWTLLSLGKLLVHSAPQRASFLDKGREDKMLFHPSTLSACAKVTLLAKKCKSTELKWTESNSLHAPIANESFQVKEARSLSSQSEKTLEMVVGGRTECPGPQRL